MLAAKISRKNNTSGVPGADGMAAKGLWRAAICFKGKRHCLGGWILSGDESGRLQKKLNTANQQIGSLTASDRRGEATSQF